MVARMEAMRDIAGNLRGDLDYRDVPASLMAAYLGIGRSTFYERWTKGVYPREAAKLVGRHTYFKPRVILGVEESSHAR